MKKFPLIWAILFSFLAVGLAFTGFTITPAVLITVAIVVYCVTYKFYFFPVMAVIWGAGLYWIFGFNVWATLCACSLTLPVALIIAICFKLKTSFAALISVSSLAETGVSAMWIYSYTNKIGKTAAELLCEPMIETIKLIRADYAAQAEEMLVVAVDLVFPSMLIISAVLIAYTIFGFSRIFLKKNGLVYKHMPAFDELNMNRSQGVVFVAILILSLIFGMYSPVLYNVITIVSTLFTVCGLSVVCFYLKSFGMPPYLRVIVCVMLVTFMSGFISPILFVLGIWDSFKTLRKKFFVI